MIYRSKAPLRIGLAGGGTDVSPYCDQHDGAVLNVTINSYAYAHIELINDDNIILHSLDKNERGSFKIGHDLPIDGHLDLMKGVYNRMNRDFNLLKTGLKLTTYVDAPPGCGLGTSSTLVVAMIGVFKEMLSLDLQKCEIAPLAYDIERNDLSMAGGRQDQYAATFGGVNFMEFFGDNVIVNPLLIKKCYLLELENNLLLYYTGTSRESAEIIKNQQKNVRDKKEISIDAMHQLKQQAHRMKEALMKGNLDEIGEILDFGFKQKQQMAEGIATPLMHEIYETAKRAGATGGKVSGAGGGGFMIFYCPGTTKYKVMQVLEKFGGYCKPYQFTQHGLTTWSI